MANPARRKGTDAENYAITVYRRWYPLCERRVQRGKNDAGDIAGLPVPCEVKWNVADISAAVKEAATQAVRLGIHGYVCDIHARGKPAMFGYGVTHSWFMAELVAGWDWARHHGWEGAGAEEAV